MNYRKMMRLLSEKGFSFENVGLMEYTGSGYVWLHCKKTNSYLTVYGFPNTTYEMQILENGINWTYDNGRLVRRNDREFPSERVERLHSFVKQVLDGRVH